jgi:two-component system, OmpR family, bacitracin resistance sensor histidine kinase BceS
MIMLFIKQHMSWLMLLFGLQLFLNILLYVDVGIENVSLVYLNTVWLVLILLFCIVRFTLDRRLIGQYPERKGNYYTTIQADYEQQIEEQKAHNRQQHLQLLEKQDELLAWVHEMKAPLTAMRLLQDNVTDLVLKERLNNEWLRLHLLLDQQLHATRLMAIEQDNMLYNVIVKDIVAKEVKELRSWFFEKQIALDIDDVDLNVISDAKWLGFIIRQLLTNALKYSEAGQEIYIYTTENNHQQTLHIQDFGQGIAPEDLPRVFRKSYTGTLGRETSAASGMGLYLVKQAADALHINVSITSKLGEGTTVSLQFSQMNEYLKTFSK